MKNREYYKDEILSFNERKGDWCVNFVKPIILNSFGKDCTNVGCERCWLIQCMWLEEEYRESEIDWSQVEVDTPVRVRTCDGTWLKRHFAKESQGVIYTWNDGKTSWSLENADANDWKYTEPWDYAKLDMPKEKDND